MMGCGVVDRWGSARPLVPSPLVGSQVEVFWSESPKVQEGSRVVTTRAASGAKSRNSSGTGTWGDNSRKTSTCEPLVGEGQGGGAVGNPFSQACCVGHADPPPRPSPARGSQ